MNLISKVAQFIADNQLFNKQNHLIVGVSGGIDSMVLCHVLKKLGYTFSIAHVNYNLRGKESKRDEQFVAKQAKLLGVVFYLKRFNTNQFITEHKLNLQEAARTVRYTWFNELSLNIKNAIICTAHHVNDSVETTLFNLTRGTGLNGLTGIKPKRNNIVRPFLGCTKKEIEAFAVQHQIKFVEDSSNKKTVYKRNLIRQQIIPLLQQINPEVVNHIHHTQQILSAQYYYYLQHINQLKKQIIKKTYNGFTIDATKLTKHNFASFLLFELLSPYGYNFTQCEDILTCINQKQSGKQFIANNCTVFVSRNQLLVQDETTNNINEVFTINNLPQKIKINNTWFAFTVVPYTTKFEFTPGNLYLDAGVCNLPFTISTIQPGDQFSPLGMKGKKKISDFLIDKKVSIPDKQAARKLKVNNKTAALLPYQIDHAFRIIPNTKNVLVITIKKGD